MAERARLKLKLAKEALEKELIATSGEGRLLTKAREQILGQQPMELLNNLKTGKVSAVGVLEAFQAKAIEESNRTNCITAFIPEAKQWARDLDTSRTEASVRSMPLFGMPFSVKDMLSVKGMDTTLGLAKRVDVPLPEDAVCVQLFKSLGGVPFVMTNVPLLCMSYTCNNPLFGETVNPFYETRTSGGSSGGEGALIGAGGSFLGFGTDLGGSARIPAHWCGIASIKPTSRRSSGKGTVVPIPVPPGVYGTMGIMGKDAAIVVEATRAYYAVDQNQFDVEIPPVPWRDYMFRSTVEKPLKQKLKIGYYTNVLDVKPTPGIMRAITTSIKTLENLGHEVVPFKSSNIDAAAKLWLSIVDADGGECVEDALKGELVSESMKHLNEELSKQAADKNDSKKAPGGEPAIRSIGDFWRKIEERAMCVDQFASDWKQQNLDLLLSPVWPILAPPTDVDTELIGAIGGYTFMYNALDFPCAVVPVTKESHEDQKLLESFSMKDQKLTELFKKYTRGAVGMPLGVQFVALPFCEEILCRIMLEFSEAVNYKP